MRLMEAAQRGKIKIIPDGKGGVVVEGKRRDVQTIANAVQKREHRNAKRLRACGS